MQRRPVNKRKTWGGRELKEDDAIMEDPRDDDIIIPVMGPTGVGKSTFINAVAGWPATSVGHDLQSHTSEIRHVILPHSRDPNRRIVLVDTPGFDDTFVQDSEILRRIAVWLAKAYSDKMKLAGVIYLHEISQTRMLGATRKNLQMFNKLCGEGALKNVILATTKWCDVKEDVGCAREEQLAERHWKHMLDLGSRMRRFSGTSESAWDIIELLLANDIPDAVDAVQIQEELVEIEKLLAQTEAGQILRYTLNELLEAQKNTTGQVQKEDKVCGNDKLQERIEENADQIHTTLQQIKSPLNIHLSKRIKAIFKFKYYGSSPSVLPVERAI